MKMNEPVTQIEIDQRVYDLYDEYCHGRIDRRDFLIRCGAIAGGLVMAQALFPRYAEAQTISFTDARMKAQYVTYPSPGGNSGTMRGYLVNASFPDGSSWNSSLRRDDTGNGACEVFYVQSITAAETAPKTDDATVALR